MARVRIFDKKLYTVSFSCGVFDFQQLKIAQIQQAMTAVHLLSSATAP
jgi:hypothetical protein